MEEKKAMLTEGSVGRHLLAMALPVLIGIFAMMGQGLIDAYFLGQVGHRALAAYAFAFPMLMIVTSVAIGMGAGTSSVVARAIGAQDMRRARRLATDSLFLSFLITLAFCILGVLTINPLFRLLGAPDDMIPMIREFMLILYSGVPFVVVGMVGMASMRATGDTRLPSTLMIMAAILNVILDPIFIFGLGPIPALGLNGAAVAALIARGVLFVGALYLMRGRLNMISFNRPDPVEMRKSWRDILHVGIPAAGTNAIVPIATAIITALIASYGIEAVAGFGVASRIESLVLVMFYALSAVIGPFVGQNLAAGNKDRILEALRLCMWFCVVSGLVGAGMLVLVSASLPAVFNDNEEVVSVAKLFLLIAPWGYGGYGLVMTINAAFNGLGRPMPGVVVSLMRTILLYVPLALVAQHFYGMIGIFTAYTVANVITGFVAYAWVKKTVNSICSPDS
jgi:putative MATE family efflux protein